MFTFSSNYTSQVTDIKDCAVGFNYRRENKIELSERKHICYTKFLFTFQIVDRES